MNSSRETSGKSCRFSSHGLSQTGTEGGKEEREGEGEKVAGESWGRNKGGRERERADKSGLKGGTSDGEQKVWKESSSRKARKVGHFTFARTSSPSALCQQLCLLVTDVVAYVYLYKHTHTYTYIVQTDTRAKDVVERLLEDSPFSRKNVNFSVKVEKGEGKREKENRQKRIDPRTNGQRANPDVLTILYRIRRGEYSFVGKIDSSIDAHPPSYPVDQESRYSIGFVFDSVLRKHRKFHG